MDGQPRLPGGVRRFGLTRAARAAAAGNDGSPAPHLTQDGREQCFTNPQILEKGHELENGEALPDNLLLTLMGQGNYGG
jgi:hypothetical protein